MLKEAQEGVKGGTLAGGSPFAGGLRRPQPLRSAVGRAVNERQARVEPRPYEGLEKRGEVGDGRTLRVVEDADPYGGWETGHVPHNIPRDHPTPGRGSAERSDAGRTK